MLIVVLISKLVVVEGVEVVTGNHPAGVGVTATLVLSGKEAVVFDTLCYPEDTASLLESLKREGREVVALVDTHWHVDHVAGNGLFNARTLSQKECPGLMATRLPEQLKGSKEFEGLEPRLPGDTFEERFELAVGDKRIILLHSPGHTPDSLIGYLMEERVLIAGDTVMDLPYIGYGDSEKLIQSLRAIERMEVGKIVQGHGGVCEKSKVPEDVKYLETARKIVGEYVDSGKSREEIGKLPVEMFLPGERCEQLHKVFKTWVHGENLETIYDELTRPATIQLKL